MPGSEADLPAGTRVGASRVEAVCKGCQRREDGGAVRGAGRVAGRRSAAGSAGAPVCSIGLVLALGINGFSYFYSDKLALRSMAPGRCRRPSSRRCTGSCANWPPAARQPMPRLYVSPTVAPNAFATGRNPRNAAVCATAGHPADPGRARAAGRARARAQPRLQPRHPDLLGGRRARRRASPTSRSSRCSSAAATATDDINPLAALLMMILGPLAAGLIQLAISPLAGVPGRPVRCRAGQRPAGPGLGPAQAGGGHGRAAAAAGPAAGHDQSSDDRQPVQRARAGQSVLHPPADGRAHRPARGHGPFRPLLDASWTGPAVRLRATRAGGLRQRHHVLPVPGLGQRLALGVGLRRR